MNTSGQSRAAAVGQRRRRAAEIRQQVAERRMVLADGLAGGGSRA